VSFPSLVSTASSVSSVLEFSTLTFLAVEVDATVAAEDSVVGLGSGVVVTVPGVDVFSVPGVVGVSASVVVSIVGVLVSVAGVVLSSGVEVFAAVDEVDPTGDVVGVPTGGTNTVLD